MPDQFVGLDPESFDVLTRTLATVQDQLAAIQGGTVNGRVVPQVTSGPPACIFRVTGAKSGDYYPAVITYFAPNQAGDDKWQDLTAVRVMILNDEKLETGRRYHGLFTGGSYQNYPVVQCGGNNSSITIDVPIRFGIDPGPPCTLYVIEYRRYVIRGGFLEIVSSSIVAGP